MISNSLVTVYSKEECIFCELTKKYLKARGIDHVIIDDKKYDKNELMKKTGSRSFPQVFVKEKYIGGYEDLKKLHIYKSTDHRLKEISGEVTESMTVEDTEYDRFTLFDGKKKKNSMTFIYYTKKNLPRSGL